MAAARNNRRHRRNRGRFGPLFKLLCLSALILALTVGATVFFRVESVVVSGNSRYTQEEVVAASGIEMGDNLFALNKNRIDARLRESLPYIGDVTIRRSLPSSILISVTEWDAVARVAAPQPEQVAAAQEEAPGAEDGSQAEPAAAAREPWLISVNGKLLEPAPADSSLLLVTGITPLMPSAGTMLALPQSETAKKDGLLGLLAALEEQGVLDGVSQIDLGDTRIQMRYLDRFDVELPLNGDFSYLLQVLSAAVEDLNGRIGPDCTGTLDLTRDDYPAVYSPE